MALEIINMFYRRTKYNDLGSKDNSSCSSNGNRSISNSSMSCTRQKNIGKRT